jgi:hypothetical protein
MLLRALPLNRKFQTKMFFSTPRYATQWRVDSPLCGKAQSRFLLSNLIEYLREFEYICKTVLAHESTDPRVQFNEKTKGRKSRETVPLRSLNSLIL